LETTVDVEARQAKERKIGSLNFVEGLDRRTLAITAFLLGIAIMLVHRPWKLTEIGDPAVYDYIAQSILRGQIPYRDVVDIKGPGAGYLSAFAMLLGKTIGLRDIIAVRLMHVVMVGLLSTIIFVVAEIYLRNRFAAVIAFLIPLMPEHFATMLVSGTQPKLPMILFGMITLLLIAKDKPLWAGVFSMLSCLCWQPGLMFTGTAVLIFSRYLTSWRDLRALKCMIGAAIPLILVVSYFYSRSALGDLWAWTITYNYGTFGPEAKKSTVEALEKFWRVVLREFRPDTSGYGGNLIGRFRSRFEPAAGLLTLAMVPASLIGLLLFAIERARAKFRRNESIDSNDSSDNIVRDALLMPPVVYLVFCLINFQSGPDLIPFFPFIGIFAAWFLVRAGKFASSIGRSESGGRHLVKQWYLPAFATMAIVLVLAARALTLRSESWTLESQDRELTAISELLGPNDKIYVHGSVEILVLLNKPNLNPYVFLDWDADTFAGSRKPGGWSGIMDEMEAQAPKLVAISRLRAVTHRADFERWVGAHYDKLEMPTYERIFIRRQE
jgi:hypothetical protein